MVLSGVVGYGRVRAALLLPVRCARQVSGAASFGMEGSGHVRSCLVRAERPVWLNKHGFAPVGSYAAWQCAVLLGEVKSGRDRRGKLRL